MSKGIDCYHHNFATVWPEILAVIKFETFLMDLNLAVWYGIPYVHACGKNLADFNLVVERHTAKQPDLIPH